MMLASSGQRQRSTMKKIIGIFIVGCILSAGTALAEEARLEASLEMNSVSLGNPVYLYLTFYGSRDIRAPEVDQVDGLTIKYVGPSTKISVVNGRVSQSVRHSYLVISKKPGRYELGPFFTHFEGKTYKGGPVTLTVSGAPSQPAPTASASPPSIRQSPPSAPDAEESSYISDNIFMRIEVPKRTAYINELIPVTIKVYVRGVGLKDIEYPVYAHEGFAAEEFEEPEKRSEVYRGQRYDVLVFQQDISGIKEGKFKLGPAKLNCKVITRRQRSRRSSFFGASIFDDDFFSMGPGYKVYPVELSAKPVEIRVLPFPVPGKPPGFKGAVGDFSLDVNIEPRKVKAGDPVSVRMAVSGLGNMATVTEPRIAVGDDFKTYEPQVTQKEYKKIYEQIVIPKSHKVTAVPEVTFSYFDPGTQSYRTLKKGPFSIDVEKRPESEKAVTMVTLPGEDRLLYPEEDLGRDIVFIKESLGGTAGSLRPVYTKPAFWGFHLFAVVLFAGLYVSHANKRRIRTDKTYAKFLKAPKKARKGISRAAAHISKDEVELFYDVIFRTFQDYLSGKLDLPRGGVDYAAVREKLAPSGCPEDLLNEISRIFEECEMARYAPSSVDSSRAEETLNRVKKAIGQLERLRI
ncbi:MAG: hypothetical protein GF408_04430 [Candidatus Omnitrophica bacterium]|nr:hypothetical protein [Candidatus Omnitrophota bacterium]